MAKLFELGRRILAWCAQHKVLIALVVTACVVIAPNVAFATDGVDLWTKFSQNPIDATALMLAGLINIITGFLGKIMLLLIEMVVVPILGYNGFYNSQITNLGWSLVRDIVNMFVVVVLLVIAVMTIVGYSAANWTQQLPRLFIAIVLVNFSKLICGVFIDISQVIMFTFVNAIVSIAAGNFAAMLGLQNFGQFSADFLDKQNEAGDGIQSFMFLGAAYFQFVIYLAILSVLFLLAVAFIWRIVVLWVLIIMAPLAFFMIGIKDIFHTAEGVFSNWKGKFVSALTFGPVLTFFLWLALAASSGASLAQTEDFPMPDEPTNLGMPLEMFDLTNFLGMFIALALLIAGMQQASSMAKGMEGFASSVISDKMGMGLLKGIAKKPISAARGFKSERAWAGQQAQKGAAWTGQFAPTLTKKAGEGMAKVGTAVSGAGRSFQTGLTDWSKKKGRVTGALGSMVGGLGAYVAGTAGGAMGDIGSSTVTGAKSAVKDIQKRGLEGFEHQTDAQEMATRNRALGAMSADPVVMEQDLAFRRKMLTDQSARGKHREEMEKSFEADVKKKHSDWTPEQVKVEAKRLAEENYTNTMRNLISESESTDGKVLYGFSGDEKDRLDDMKTANPHLIKPKAGQSREDAIKEHYQKMSDKGRLDIRTIHKGAFADKDAEKALKSFMVDTKDGKKASVWSQIESGAGTIDQRKAMAGLITADAILDPTDGKKNLKTLVSAGAIAEDNPADPRRGARRDAVIQSIQSADRDTIDAPSHGAAAAALLSYKEGTDDGYDPEDVFGGNFTTLASDGLPVDDSLVVQTDAMLESDISSARHFSSVIREDAGPSFATEMVANRVTKSSVQRLESTRSGGGPGSTESGKALEVIGRAVDQELVRENRKPEGMRNKNRVKKLEEIQKEITVGKRYRPVPPRHDGGGPPPPPGGGGATPPGGGGNSDPDDDDNVPPPTRGGNGGGGGSNGGGGGAAAAGTGGFVAGYAAGSAGSRGGAAEPEPDVLHRPRPTGGGGGSSGSGATSSGSAPSQSTTPASSTPRRSGRSAGGLDLEPEGDDSSSGAQAEDSASVLRRHYQAPTNPKPPEGGGTDSGYTQRDRDRQLVDKHLARHTNNYFAAGARKVALRQEIDALNGASNRTAEESKRLVDARRELEAAQGDEEFARQAIDSLQKEVDRSSE